MALEGGSPFTVGVKTCWGFPHESSVPSHPPQPDRFQGAAQMSLALDAELHWLQGASTPGSTEEAQGGLVQSREALRRLEHLP